MAFFLGERVRVIDVFSKDAYIKKRFIRESDGARCIKCRLYFNADMIKYIGDVRPITDFRYDNNVSIKGESGYVFCEHMLERENTNPYIE